MKIAEVVTYLNSLAPVVLQEAYDNSGLQVGDPDAGLKGILVTLDVTEDVIDEAVRKGTNLVVSHHPLLFSPLKRVVPSGPAGRAVIAAVKKDIAVYSAHTNLDNVIHGVNGKMAQKIGLVRTTVLQPVKSMMKKLVTFVPAGHLDTVRDALFAAGAGRIGDYDMCSFSLEGEGTFRGLEGTQPFLGEKGKFSREKETRTEVIFPGYLESDLIRALLHAHPYEEVAYDVYPLENSDLKTGAGLIGVLNEEIPDKEFLQSLKKTFRCGGSGSFLLPEALAHKADIFISADFRYHQFFDADGKIIIADIGHFESEQYTKEIFYENLIKKYSNFAIHFSEIVTNPVKYI